MLVATLLELDHNINARTESYLWCLSSALTWVAWVMSDLMSVLFCSVEVMEGSSKTENWKSVARSVSTHNQFHHTLWRAVAKLKTESRWRDRCRHITSFTIPLGVQFFVLIWSSSICLLVFFSLVAGFAIVPTCHSSPSKFPKTTLVCSLLTTRTTTRNRPW